MEEKPIYVEDEIFSSSRRTSATASSDKSKAPALKPQTVEKDAASNYHPYEDNKGEESRNNDEPSKESKNLQFSQRITTTTPEPTTSVLYQTRSSIVGDKPQRDAGGESLENSSEDPLYASDEGDKVYIFRFIYCMLVASSFICPYDSKL